MRMSQNSQPMSGTSGRFIPLKVTGMMRYFDFNISTTLSAIWMIFPSMMSWTIQLVKIDIHNDAHGGDNLVGYIFHQTVNVFKANHLMVIVHTEVHDSPLCICEAANPL